MFYAGSIISYIIHNKITQIITQQQILLTYAYTGHVSTLQEHIIKSSSWNNSYYIDLFYYAVYIKLIHIL